MGNLSIVGGNVVIDVKIAVMQDDHKSGYDCSMACPKCKGEVKRPQVCINPNCDQEIDDTQKSDHQNLRYFKDDPDKKMFTKKQIDECKEADKHNMKIIGVESKNFDRRRILECHYVYPDKKGSNNGGDQSRYEILYHGLKNSDKALSIHNGRTGTEKLGILTVENDTMVLFTVAHAELIRKPTEVIELDNEMEEDYTKCGVKFLENLKEVDTMKIESQSRKNYQALLEGKQVVIEQKKTRKKMSAMEMFQN